MIGIIGRLNDSYTFNKEIIEIINKYNYISLGIIVDFNNDPILEFNKTKPLIDMCDGFILQGGCEYYDIDILITKYLHKNNIPTLGICLGMQTMAVAFNGTIGTTLNHNNCYHNVYIKSSKLHNIINKRKLKVNSRHKDYVINTDLSINAYSDIIEGIEDRNKPFFIGVQWHPESLKDENSDNLFNNFFLNVKNASFL